MCSYCGCEAEAVIAGFMADHARIGDLEYRILQAVDDQRLDDAAGLTRELAEVFSRHSLAEESGLFAQLQQHGEAVEEVDRLVGEHRRLRPSLAAEDLVSDPERLRQLLAELALHAEVEDNDLFPFAIQVLPDDCWAELAA
jgi:hemerythrin-like domain-containing protein